MSKLWEIAHLSNSHISAAILFAKQAKVIEEQREQYVFVGQWEYSSHTSYIIGSIVLSVAFLEASINEKFEQIHFEIKERYAESFLKIDWPTRERISKIWGKTEKFKTLDKYDLLSTLIKNEELDKGNSTYENIKLLIKLRNYLIHFKPETIEYQSYENEKVEIHRLGEKLKGKFMLNPLMPSGSPFFPNKCLSYGCARWAITSAIDFVDAFMCLIGLTEYAFLLKKDIHYADFE